MMDHIDGQPWALTGTTGTMAASLAANSCVFAMGAVADVSLSAQPNTPRRAPLEIEGLRMTFTAIVAGAAASGQVLQIFKGATNTETMPVGGAALTALEKYTLDRGGDSGMIGDAARISTTTGLTLTGPPAFARGTVPLATFDLNGAVGIGTRLSFDYFEDFNGAPLWLAPGEILVVSNPNAFQALMTWALTVNIDYRRRDSR